MFTNQDTKRFSRPSVEYPWFGIPILPDNPIPILTTPIVLPSPASHSARTLEPSILFEFLGLKPNGSLHGGARSIRGRKLFCLWKGKSSRVCLVDPFCKGDICIQAHGQDGERQVRALYPSTLLMPCIFDVAQDSIHPLGTP